MMHARLRLLLCLLLGLLLPPSTLSVGPLKISYRNYRPADLPSVAALCIQTFDLPSAFEQELQNRYESLVVKGYKHSMVVAEDSDSKRMVGFVEVGTLPSPIPVSQLWAENRVESYPDVPYLGIGYRLASIGTKVAEKWGDSIVYAAVRPDNLAARSMYESLGFSLALDESQLISRRTNIEPRLFFCKSWSTVAANAEATQ